ncbi:hypothetical protein BW79_16105 [Escherichia coli O119:H4 str. 03-3458]|nr:hypothetical protein BW79_16105 [Escherichia coli O119:H4 str. 03-3458]
MFQLLIDMSEAVEPAVRDKKTLCEIYFIICSTLPLILALPRTVAPWQEVTVVGQQQESCVKHDFPVVILQHNCLRVINQPYFHTDTEVAEGANQRFLGVPSILFWCGEDMEAAGEPQRINRKVNFAPEPGNLHLNFASVMLELVS